MTFEGGQRKWQGPGQGDKVGDRFTRGVTSQLDKGIIDRRAVVWGNSDLHAEHRVATFERNTPQRLAVAFARLEGLLILLELGAA